MGFKNSMQHVQRCGDIILRGPPFAKAYMGDFVVYSTTLKQHMDHLAQFFKNMAQTHMNTSMAPEEAYIGYPSVRKKIIAPTAWLKKVVDFQPEAIEPISFSSKCLSLAEKITP
ncbi:hypothetical protein K504DRAFT_506276 [Pleomassaria siparia CBS 279.74]|uniref:Reverse transcriptase domain-containing protein n=1 Tax=Pleomassaria siparia CBS 279.74 TaxID=1314801 RepID=A0A6G1JXK2_9PLEO|nr:hypothetical protein K504DRAFT_506276 [Pleomassaria siparia CBS 279.74]